ncbi:MAG: hypothetical protein CME32_00895 [Gimesia sp.]|nr:hypothetical protein [Gimesia sp.]
MSRFLHLIKNPSDLRYALDKAGSELVRGYIWQLMHLRVPRPLYLGPHIKFVSSERLKLGSGVFIGGGSYIESSAEEGVELQDNVTIRENAWLQCRSGFNKKGVGLLLESGVYIGPNSVIGVGGKIVIRSGCQIGACVSFAAESHEFKDGSYTTGSTSRVGIEISNNTWLGNNVTVLDGVYIGSNCVIGACSTVTKSIPNNSVAIGSPARIIRTLES